MLITILDVKSGKQSGIEMSGKTLLVGSGDDNDLILSEIAGNNCKLLMIVIISWLQILMDQQVYYLQIVSCAPTFPGYGVVVRTCELAIILHCIMLDYQVQKLMGQLFRGIS